MADWQPIETAPKDGTVIDLWVVGGHDGCLDFKGIAYRDPECLWLIESAAPRWIQRVSGSDAVEDSGLRATHWMPLPDPPSTPTRIGE